MALYIPEYKPYTGVGSRKTPENIKEFMELFASASRLSGYTLRSGHAEGADMAFERGALGDKEIYLPYKSFRGSDSLFYRIPEEAYLMASSVHPNWGACLRSKADKFHARNAMQVYGANLDFNSLFLLCWTPRGKVLGGTATAIRLAEARDIPVFNLGVPSVLESANATVDRMISRRL